jgi:hypothetical protein
MNNQNIRLKNTFTIELLKPILRVQGELRWTGANSEFVAKKWPSLADLKSIFLNISSIHLDKKLISSK